MEKISKEVYCLINNLDPELFESVEEAAKFLNWQDKLNIKNLRIEYK